MAYRRAEIVYLKKRYPNLQGGVTSKAIRFEIIEGMRQKYPLRWPLEFAEVSRAGYYKWRKGYPIQVLVYGKSDF